MATKVGGIGDGIYGTLRSLLGSGFTLIILLFFNE